ncbi:MULTISPECIES: 2Fe-2S iron-sulfur cluster-binding protein [Oceanospirillaceae]|jgi:ferredoxin|uniref:2Fe-2S iron-sulfur cluster-binding protein n=1 Tax=Oceanobacter antarcticus TaxID=3133425 RepID=A0ABW8NML1_9GAMM|tara:strand:- start:21437 stop:21784 length:348 start_codon:yes stop_codon:yes gene_type:complete
MAILTFSNPSYKDKTVYATAGSHTESVLKIARENKIPIDFNCEDGNCGTCLIKVTPLGSKPRMAGPLTDKEVSALTELGKISKDDVDTMRVDDLPTVWRLACQLIARDEELLIEY